MATKVIGGGSSAVAASSHAACARFRGTDPLVTGLTRRGLAAAVACPDDTGKIPQARWMRAMTFERLVRGADFASKIATTAVGHVGLERPSEVVTVNAHVNAATTASLLSKAHERAVSHGAATLIYGLAVPFVGFEDSGATDVKPDFAVVAPKNDRRGSWLIIGDAKDYERLRSRIDDTRMLKGFLQVAVGAESCRVWSRLPVDMEVHSHGVLAVPRNAFLQPTAVVEDLTDYNQEVLLRIAERHAEVKGSTFGGDPASVPEFVAHLKATFDPAACTTCTLFGYCREELRRSPVPTDLLIELGVERDLRAQAAGLVDGESEIGRVPKSVEANIAATLKGVAQSTGQLRVDQVGASGTINLVLAKSDAAALGVHGVAFQRLTARGGGDWETYVYDDPQSPTTRRKLMRALGKAIGDSLGEQRKANSESPGAVHLVVPDAVTADVLVSVADNLAGIELSRLRWQRDREMGRPALTFDGEPAVIPAQLTETERTAISFLLDDDRGRAFSLRCPIVDARAVLARHWVAGGPAANFGRLDYLVGWAEAKRDDSFDHRSFGDEIERSVHTPGARLTNATSDKVHEALVGPRQRKPDAAGGDPIAYDRLVRAELNYKRDVLARAVAVIASLPSSKLRDVYRAIECDAQAVWRRRLSLHASDLVRFGRTYRVWRNDQVSMIESDVSCDAQLLALGNPQAASDMATSAGTRQVAFATVVSLDPIVLDVESRRIVEGSRIVLLTVDDEPCVERPDVSVDLSLSGSFKIDGLSIGSLAGPSAGEPTNRLVWSPQLTPDVDVGDRLVVADRAWFPHRAGDRFLHVDKPKADTRSAPTPDCRSDSYDEDPEAHRWCCRPHESYEAEVSDNIARRRAAGELNPETWPPVRDGDEFETSPSGAAQGDVYAAPTVPVPDDLTIDDVD